MDFLKVLFFGVHWYIGWQEYCMAAAAAAAAASVEAQSAAPFLVTSHQPTQALLLNISRNVHF